MMFQTNLIRHIYIIQVYQYILHISIKRVFVLLRLNQHLEFGSILGSYQDYILIGFQCYIIRLLLKQYNNSIENFQHMELELMKQILVQGFTFLHLMIQFQLKFLHYLLIRIIWLYQNVKQCFVKSLQIKHHNNKDHFPYHRYKIQLVILMAFLHIKSLNSITNLHCIL